MKEKRQNSLDPLLEPTVIFEVRLLLKQRRFTLRHFVKRASFQNITKYNKIMDHGITKPTASPFPAMLKSKCALGKLRLIQSLWSHPKTGSFPPS